MDLGPRSKADASRSRYAGQTGFSVGWCVIAFVVLGVLTGALVLGLPMVVTQLDFEGSNGMLVSIPVWFVGGLLIGMISPGRTFIEPVVAALSSRCRPCSTRSPKASARLETVSLGSPSSPRRTSTRPARGAALAARGRRGDRRRQAFLSRVKQKAIGQTMSRAASSTRARRTRSPRATSSSRSATTSSSR
jgi:hypothetical protein